MRQLHAPTAARTRTSPRSGAGVLALALLAALPAHAQSLRYDGEEGQTDRYRLTNTVRIHQELQGAATDLTVHSYSLLTLVLERAEDDTLSYGVTFDSLDLRFEGAPVPPPDLSCILGNKMTLQLSPRGEVYRFDVPAEMCATPAGFDLKQMVSHFFPRLPEGERAESGTTWSDTLSFPVSQQGIESSVQVVTDYTSRGTTAEGGGGEDFVAVDYRTATTISGKGEQGGAPLFLDGRGTGEGRLLFAGEGETFWSSTGTQTLELVIDVTPEGQPPLSIPIRQEITAEIQHL